MGDTPETLEHVGPDVKPDGVTFRLLDPAGDISSVALVQEVADPRVGPALRLLPGGLWEGTFSRPPVDRFEYRFEIGRRGSEHELVLDPANPLRAPGAFGERSVIEFPDYEPPAWLSAEPPAGHTEEIEVRSARLGDVQTTLVWSAAGTDPRTPLPLLVALDGLEFARFSGLLGMLDAMVASGALPPMRAALCQPTRRGEEYTASRDFPAYLASELIPAVRRVGAVTPERRLRAGLGASLGGLALLHAHRKSPGLFGALLLQSSSFFQMTDQHPPAPIERLERFVEEVIGTTSWSDPIPVTMTCGTVEQNLENNRRCAAALAAQGYPATLHEVRDAHNWIAWRDAWTPHLVDLLSELFG